MDFDIPIASIAESDTGNAVHRCYWDVVSDHPFFVLVVIFMEKMFDSFIGDR